MATEKNNPQTGPFLGVIFGASGDLAKRKRWFLGVIVTLAFE